MLTLVWLWPAAAWAAQEEMITDRPDQTESAVVVPPGAVQFETGWTWERVNGESRHSFPGSLLRWGWFRRLEFRLGWDGAQWLGHEPGDLESGVGDGEIGAKLGLWGGPESAGQGAVLVGLSVPWGSSAFSSGSVDPSIRFSVAHELGDRHGLGWNLGWTWPGEGKNAGRESRLFYTVSWGLELSSRWAAFVEVFGDASTEGGDHATSLDGGFTWLAGERWQLDASAGVGLNSAAPDSFVGLGSSFRWPH